MRKSRRYILYGVGIFGIILVLMGTGIMSVRTSAAEINTEEKTVQQETLTHMSDIYLENETIPYPEETIEQSGKLYELISAELKAAVKSGTLTYVSTVVPYKLEGRQEPPEMATITLKDAMTGEAYDREVSCQEVIEQRSVWEGGFSFPITIYGYESEAFLLGDTEVPAGADLSDYKNVFLEYLELPCDCYRIDTITWNGESYELDGDICRDATAYGEKLVRYVEVRYGGQIRTPDLAGKQYEAVYKEIIQETEGERNETSAVVDEAEIASVYVPKQEQNSSFFEAVKQWIKEHVTVVVLGIVFFMGFLGISVLLYLSRETRQENKQIFK